MHSENMIFERRLFSWKNNVKDFNQIARKGRFSNALFNSGQIKGITTDGTYLHLQGTFETAHGLPYFFNFYKATLGNLN